MAKLAIRCVASLVPNEEDEEYWRLQQRLLRNTDRCLEVMVKGVMMEDSELWTYGVFGNLYADQGRRDKAEAMYEQALQGYEKAWGPEHTSTLGTVNNLGTLYADQGRLDKAEAMFERALQGYEKALDAVILKTYVPALNTLECFGILHQQRGKPDLAQQYYFRAQDGLRAVFGDDSNRARTISERIKEVNA
jgi:tetratricopeptide (TPR) repeat protein